MNTIILKIFVNTISINLKKDTRFFVLFCKKIKIK